MTDGPRIQRPRGRGRAAQAVEKAEPTSVARPSRAGFRRVCILTGGGDAPGLNAVLRGFVKTCVELEIEVYGSEDGFEGLIQRRPLVTLSRASVQGILPKGGSILGCSNRSNPFAYPVRTEDGREDTNDVSKHVVNRLHRHGIDALVLVGGDSTMRHARAFVELGVDVVAIPKTIDNDLCGTDCTFGFDTALNTATWAIDALHSTAESHDRVMVVELMGRDAGWIALSAGIAGGADVVVIPEIPYDIERIINKIKRRAELGATFSIVVVGEGARPHGGMRSTLKRASKQRPRRLGGAGQVLASQLEGRIPHEIRVTVLGHLQRGGSPSAFDRLLGTRFGVRAAMCCERGQSGVMVALRGQDIVEIPIDAALRVPRLVPPQGELVDTARRIGIELGA